MISNYGDKHFGVSVFDYFPWYQYPDSILEKPILNRYYPIYRQVIKFDLSSVWYVVDGEYFQTGGGYTKAPTFLIDRLNGNVNNSQTVESWIDIEKIRLINNLGLKQEAEEYLNKLYKINNFIEVIEDFELDYNEDLDFDINTDFTFCNIDDIKSKFGLLTDDEVISFIRQYNGDNIFYLSLKSYLSKKGCLTFRQIKSIKDNPPINYFEHQLHPVDSGVCLIINNSDSSIFIFNINYILIMSLSLSSNI